MHATRVGSRTPFVAAIAIGMLSGCAGATAGPGGITRSMPTGSMGAARPGVGLEVTARNDGQSQSLAASPADVYAAVLGAYTDLKIPLTREDASARVLGNDGIKLRRQLGRIEMRKAFECGGTSGMPNAETYQILASIVTTVEGEGENAVMTTVITATGENPSYPGSGVRCTTTGAIESAIVREVRIRLNSR
jgi:hypothetical protein